MSKNSDISVGEEDGAIDASVEDRLERFVDMYVTRYRRLVDMSGFSEDMMPEFYTSFPHKVQACVFENGSIGIFFMRGDEAPVVSVTKGEFHEARWILEDKACDKFIGLRDVDEASAERADVLAERDVERELSFCRKKQTLMNLKEEMGKLEGDITDMAKVNPWLEERAAGQISRVSSTKRVIEDMENEVTSARVELFKEYISQMDILELQMLPEPADDEKKQDMSVAAGLMSDDESLETVPTLSSVGVKDFQDRSVDDNYIPDPINNIPKKTERPVDRKKIPQDNQERDEGKKPRGYPPKKSVKKEEKVPPKAEEVTPEIKKTVFRMNRRLFSMEKRVAELDHLKPSEMKRVRSDFQKLARDFKVLNAQLKGGYASQNAKIDANAEALRSLVSQGVKRAQWIAIGLGTIAIAFSILAVMMYMEWLPF